MASESSIVMADTDEITHKKKRKRLKRICAQIREQMEFYFGDANLSKDRFLKQKMEEDPDKYVPLDIFLNFNKMKGLTDDVDLIAKALSTSDLLSVSSDGKKVKRDTPVLIRENINECTIYVEGLPSTADHDWVKSHFSKFGEVLYVSLPKYKSSGDIRGFAFVEFDSEESAAGACQNTNDDNTVEGIGKFPKGNKAFKQLQKKVIALKPELDLQSLTSDVNTGKRKISDSNQGDEVEGDDETPAKRKKVDSEHTGDEVTKDGTESGDKPKKDVCSDKENSDRQGSKDNVAETVDVSKTGDSSESNKDKAKAEKRKITVEEDEPSSKESKRVRINEEVQVKETERQKHKRRRERHRSASLSDVGKEVPLLRVIPKLQWLKLKSEYLALQKKSMQQLKSSLKTTPKKNRQQNDTKKENPQKDLIFIPNVIVRVEVDKPTNRKELKERLSGTGDIAYIDFLDDECQGHIRCSGPDVATRISVANIRGHSFTILQGDDEQKYWSKVLADRQKKRSSKQRTKKRGTDKINEKVEKHNADTNQRRHIVFDD